MKRTVLMAGLLGALVLAAAAEKKPKPVPVDPNARVGMTTRVIHPAGARNWRGAEQKALDAVVWYPAVDTAIETKQFMGPVERPLFEAGSAMPHAPFAPHMERLPMVVLSHGSGGSALQMAWLGTALARAGYIAVAVDHPGNNANAPLTPEGVALWWERATDVSNVIDAMLKDEEFGGKIDATRIAAAGYSLGGYTVMELAGAQTDISVFFDRCRPAKPGDKPTDDAAVCRETVLHHMGSNQHVLEEVRKTSGESLARSAGSFRDPRVKVVFAMAPALGFTETPDSLHAIKVPVAMVVGSEDAIAPANENADYLRAHIRAARENTLPGVGHYTFLDVCTAAGVQVYPLYCTDAPGVDRAAVHAQVAGMAVEFFDRALKWR
ncbi:alpha/beta fold hydrolase [Granulicella sp. 5B5]|uniref:alpha/beta hydrolase family protein n=1 Tax=Granulicella sp. 5B5 TaxID=1617967 RepID=UPI0015F64473|nr:alpha/beta hydrolase [Granulicella sp. 5B5]QMV18878.1 alpha/beta fold hydrolase [Granulicella sp. 5B5]